MLKAASLTLIVERGVRVVADYLPPAVSRDAEYQRIFELERKLGMRPEFAAVARYTAMLGSSTGSGEGGARVNDRASGIFILHNRREDA